jgi:hypothetical protein
MSECLPSQPTFDAAHAETLELLPWFANGSLPPADATRLGRHLAGCLVCRRELAFLHELAAHVRRPREDDQCEIALARLSRRIERTPSPASRQIPWAAAAVITLCMSLVSWAADNAEQSTEWLRHAGASAWRSADPGPDRPLGPRIELVFYDDITEREFRSLVLGVGAEVIEGPTPEGRYTLGFVRQMSPGELLDVLRRLRYSRSVLFAEPAHTTRVSISSDW